MSAKVIPWKVAHLAMFDLVPPFNEVLYNVKDNRTIDCHVHLALHVSPSRMKSYKQAYVVPWHARTFQNGNSFAYIIANLMKVSDARVVVILAWKEGAREI